MAYKVKNQIPDLEDLKVDQWYAITINPQDKYQFFNRVNRITDCLHKMRDDVLQHIGSYDYKIWPELSPKGRFHVHGIIRVTDKINFYLYCVPALLSRGTLVIKEIEDPLIWEEYCKKQSELHEHISENTVFVIPLEYQSNNTTQKALIQASKQSIETNKGIQKISKESEALLKNKRFKPTL